MHGSRRTRCVTWLAIAVLAALPAGATGAAEIGTTTVVLVRHAEKTAEPQDPPLSESGRRRAAELARMLREAGVRAVYASQFRRTSDTVRPLAAELGLEVTVHPIETRDLGEYAGDFVSVLLARHRGATVVVAGHSNTVPVLIDALGAGPAPTIGEADYDDLFVVTVPVGGQARLLHLKFGAAGDAARGD